MAGLPLRYKLKLAWCMVRYKMSFADGVALYGKYVGNWGGAATCWRFDAKNGDTVVKSVTLCPSHRLHLEVTPSATVLQEGDTYDMAGVRSSKTVGSTTYKYTTLSGPVTRQTGGNAITHHKKITGRKCGRL